MIHGCNKKIACEPPENTGVSTQIRSGVALAQHRSTLTSLKVVFGSSEYPAGSIVYLPAGAKQALTTQVHELNGKKFVLVPEEMIVLVDKPEPEKPEPKLVGTNALPYGDCA